MKWGEALDPFILLPVLVLSGVSLILVLSTNPELFYTQLIACLIGLAIYVVLSRLTIPAIRRVGVLYFLIIALLLVSFLGPNVRGAHRWIELLGFRFQPSEIVKPLFILVFSGWLGRVHTAKHRRAVSWIMIIPVLLLIFRQPDLGNAIVFLFTFIILQIASGLPWRYLFTAFISSGLCIPFMWHFLKTYQKQRILTFLNPDLDPAGLGYNALQAIIAIGSGGIWGQGLGRGTQSRLLFLPEYHTDFVFASLSEELGLVGGITVLFFYVVLLIRLLYLSFYQPTLQARLMILGVFSIIFVHVFINVGMNLGILPITGITLPLISYGGSSVISTLASLALAVSAQSTREDVLYRSG